jgi:hypothetical protein
MVSPVLHEVGSPSSRDEQASKSRNAPAESEFVFMAA